ncbi:hypothetical protein C8Q80DRAFT_1266061 [Daedaleopsis nitida]|nr:hypothetical protein C8Q80DRAFT_1266061 [Daedaleopsis nitida]
MISTKSTSLACFVIAACAGVQAAPAIGHNGTIIIGTKTILPFHSSSHTASGGLLSQLFHHQHTTSSSSSSSTDVSEPTSVLTARGLGAGVTASLDGIPASIPLSYTATFSASGSGSTSTASDGNIGDEGDDSGFSLGALLSQILHPHHPVTTFATNLAATLSTGDLATSLPTTGVSARDPDARVIVSVGGLPTTLPLSHTVASSAEGSAATATAPDADMGDEEDSSDGFLGDVLTHLLNHPTTTIDVPSVPTDGLSVRDLEAEITVSINDDGSFTILPLSYTPTSSTDGSYSTDTMADGYIGYTAYEGYEGYSGYTE